MRRIAVPQCGRDSCNVIRPTLATRNARQEKLTVKFHLNIFFIIFGSDRLLLFIFNNGSYFFIDPALRSGRRLRIRVPTSPLSFVNALSTGSFGTWVHFRKVRRQPLLPIREALPVNQQEAVLD